MDQVKGWTRSTVVATFLLAASELDLSEPKNQEILKPLFKVLDKAWLLPCHVLWLRVHSLGNHVEPPSCVFLTVEDS